MLPVGENGLLPGLKAGVPDLRNKDGFHLFNREGVIMNWFSRYSIMSKSFDIKKKLCYEDQCCEHCQLDPNLAVMLLKENDSFGIVSSYVVCSECLEEHDREEDEEQVFCQDCNMKYPKKNTIAWKWYDFYAPQGDEAIIVCDSCRSKEKHLDRVDREITNSYLVEMILDSLVLVPK